MLILNVATEPLKLGYTIQKPFLGLQTTAPQLEIETQAAKLDIRQAKGTLEIDQAPCRASYGIRSQSEFTRAFAEEGWQAGLEGIGRRAAEGERLARIESGENAIVEMAYESTLPQEGELTWAHLAAPEIRYTVTPPQVEVTPGDIQLQLRRGTVEPDFQRGKVNIEVQQYNRVRFWTTENKVDLQA